MYGGGGGMFLQYDYKIKRQEKRKLFTIKFIEKEYFVFLSLIQCIFVYLILIFYSTHSLSHYLLYNFTIIIII